jgi:iron complex outermembrane receptor protein
VEGLESDLSWLIGEHLTLSASLTGLLKAETTTDFCKPTRVGAAVKTCAPADVDSFAGTQLPVTPKLKANGTARYGFNIGEYKSFVQGSVIHQSSTTYSLEAVPSALAGNTAPFTTFDFSAGTALNNWHIEAYVENAFDKRGDLGRLSECGTSYCFSNTRVYPIKPMNFGVKFGQKF